MPERAERVHAPPPLALPGTLAAAAGVVGAAAVAGAVAGGVHSHLGSAPAADRLSVAVGYVATAGLVAVLVGVFTLFVIIRPRGMRPDSDAGEAAPVSRLEKTAISAALLAIAAAPLVALLLLDRSHRRQTALTTTGFRAAPQHVSKAAPAVHIQWTFFFGLVVAGLVVLTFVAVARRRGRELAPLEREGGDLLEPAIEAGLDALEAERDPRLAVINAYTAMTRTLGAQGLPRRPVETPVEYLRRVLVELGAAASAAGRLTSLFERARFSVHDIDEGMRGDALAALAAVRDREVAAG